MYLRVAPSHNPRKIIYESYSHFDDSDFLYEMSLRPSKLPQSVTMSKTWHGAQVH